MRELNLDQIKFVYMVGIGGIGMSALARYFKAKGAEVAGYDKTETPLTQGLIMEGISVHYVDDVRQLPSWITDDNASGKVIIIYTPAIPKDHEELNYLRSKNLPVMKRSQVLGLITKDSFTIAVAGTHGKTSTSSLIAHILKDNGKNVTAFLGGVTVNYDTNYISGKPAEKNHIVVAEADEFDRSFLTLHPDIAIITSMDADHLDIYGSKEELKKTYYQFALQIKKNGTLISKKELFPEKAAQHFISYSVSGKSDCHAENIRVENGRFHFDLHLRGKVFSNVELFVPGRHNVENSVAAFAASSVAGVDPSKIIESFKTYRGVKRRFEFHIRNERIVFIDDYAHHPEELRAAISAARELYPGKKILGIFQPHLYSRTRDFAGGFAQSLSLPDSVILCDIYPARELPIPGITSEIILNKITVNDKVLCKKSELIPVLEKKNFDVLLTLGAGDIDQEVIPIKKYLEKRFSTA